MIRFLLLLPVRLFGAVCMLIGELIQSHQRRKNEREMAQIAEAKAEQIAEARAAKEAEKRVKAERTERIRMQKAEDAERKRSEAAKTKAMKEAQAEKIRASRAAERVREADNELAHLEQRQRDLTTLYSFAEKEYNDATTDKRKEAAFRKMMAIDQQRRATERQAERMKYIIDNGGR